MANDENLVWVNNARLVPGNQVTQQLPAPNIRFLHNGATSTMTEVRVRFTPAEISGWGQIPNGQEGVVRFIERGNGSLVGSRMMLLGNSGVAGTGAIVEQTEVSVRVWRFSDL